MTRFAGFYGLVALVALACGGDGTEAGHDGSVEVGHDGSVEAAAAAPVDAVERGADQAERLTETGAALDANAQSCLGLVKAGRLVEAIPSCTLAVQQRPDNEELGKALEQARVGAADSVAGGIKSAQGATGKVVDSALTDAAGAVDEAAMNKGGSAIEEATGTADSAIGAVTGDAASAMDEAKRGIPQRP